ncbi:hypothetical protein [Actinomadura sp. NTSP31]|uniref:hypothetical protein n=1 Tax=Actinomadura sp. NTSP31 TaxID=1735447 RepID=UPI0035C1F66E
MSVIPEMYGDRRRGGPDASRAVEVCGRHNLAKLAYLGCVRLHGEGGAVVEISEPQAVGDGDHRVRLVIRLSAAMTERYRDPLPEDLISSISEHRDVQAGDSAYNFCGFEIQGWGLYGSDGERVRHHSRRFILRDISKVEVIVRGDAAVLPED